MIEPQRGRLVKDHRPRSDRTHDGGADAKLVGHQGQRNAFSLDLAPASAAFQRIITLYDRVPPGFECDVELSPVAARVHQALVFSNQRYFLLADGVFNKAEALLSEGSIQQDQKDRALLTSYRAMHELNRRNPVVAGDLGLQTLDNVGRLETSFANLAGGDDLLGIDRTALRDVMSFAQALYAVGSTDLLSEGSDGGCRQDSLVRARSAIDLVKPLKNPAVEGRFRMLAARALACDETMSRIRPSIRGQRRGRSWAQHQRRQIQAARRL